MTHLSTASVQPPPLRIVMLSLHTSPLVQAGRGDAGGLNVYVDGISAALVALGHEVDIITTDVDSAPEQRSNHDQVRTTKAGVRVHELAVPDACRHHKSQLVDCLEDLTRRGVESLEQVSSTDVGVVHSHYWISGIAMSSFAEPWGAAMVHTMHTIGAIKREKDPTAREDSRRHACEQRLASLADMLTANTQQERADLQRIFGAQEEKLRVVHPGTDLSTFRPRLINSAISQSKTFRVTFAGRLQAHKGTHVAIAAVAALHRCAPKRQVQLTICGQPSGDPSVDVGVLARQEGIAHLVECIDPLPHEDLAELFRASDVVVMPSYSESFGLVALEAMACGTTVVAHAVGGLKDLITTGETGILLDTLDPGQWAQVLDSLAEDPHRRAAIGRAAAAEAFNYSWEASAVTTVKTYRQAIASHLAR